MSTLFEMASQLEHEVTEATPEELIGFATTQLEDSTTNAHAGVRVLAESVRHADASAQRLSLGAVGSLNGARGAHREALRRLAELEAPKV